MACYSSVLPARYAMSLEALARRGLVSAMACFSSVLPARYAMSLEALGYLGSVGLGGDSTSPERAA